MGKQGKQGRKEQLGAEAAAHMFIKPTPSLFYTSDVNGWPDVLQTLERHANGNVLKKRYATH